MFTIPELRVGSPVRHNNLSVVPLYPIQDTGPAADYRLSEEALAAGTAVVEEVSEGGSVPNLAVTVTGKTPVLFLEGEELRGAKQNRVLNTSVLVAGESKTLLPVSCVERGRWRYASKNFGSAGTHASYKLRKILKESSGRSAKLGTGHGSDQGAVWAEVDRHMDLIGAASPTAAMSDAYESRRDTLSEFQEKIAYPAGAIGMAAVVGSRVVAVDMFDTPSTCEKAWRRLLTGWVMGAIEEANAEGDADVNAALNVFRAGPWEGVPAAGTGEEYRAEPDQGKWYSSALTLDGRLLHGSLVAAV